MTPTVHDVVRRIGALAAVATYGLEAPPRPSIEARVAGLVLREGRRAAARARGDRDAYWMRRDPRILEALTPRERAFADATFVTMTDRERGFAAGCVEAIAALHGALKLGKPLAPDAPADVAEVLAVRIPGDAVLRCAAEIEGARSMAEAWRWRARAQRLVDKGVAPPAHFDDEIVRKTAATAHERGFLAAPIDGDFPARGQAFRTLSAEVVEVIEIISSERLRALAWLAGRAPGNAWDATPLGT